ncbi:hypothetical protein GYMLUDRAFT_242327 [Collybiopsis luxurians FD-317 M1]|uniref:Uncharacterized protein n=1 Tax=Collybiopsis luxurians FD-317 M1 TaxID=944289 RepID=A0A0D0CIY1_9AGAR|nr:hypothetical protein GYMLUDRAFT_242327 [Collybiopsis luxurians FD-317 M1]
MEYQRENPDWIISETMLSGVAVVSMQTPFTSQLHDEALHIAGPLNGIVSDAAHTWWHEHSSFYSNGATAWHFNHYFLVLFESIAGIGQDHGKQVKINSSQILLISVKLNGMGLLKPLFSFGFNIMTPVLQQSFEQKH